MSRPGFWDDEEASRQVIARFKVVKMRLDPLIDFARRLEDAQELSELAAGEEEEEGAELIAEIAGSAESLRAELASMEFQAMFAGPHDDCDAYLSIQAGAGGVDAMSWAEMMLRMYVRFLEERGYELSEVDRQRDKEGGKDGAIKNATIHVKGTWAYGHLRGEEGVHRLVRISPFDAGNRRQTSFASVAVIPDLGDRVKVELEESEIDEDFFRASGAGGQHVNTTDSAVRLTHRPTGIVVTCQNERSQARNREVARKLLKAKLYEHERKKVEAAAARSYDEKSDNAWGHAIRSYVLAPYTLVKDKRTGEETSNAQAVLDGALGPFVEAYLRSEEGMEAARVGS